MDERVRSATEHLYQALIDAETDRGDRRRPARAHPGPERSAQRQPAADTDDEDRGSGAADPKAADGIVLPVCC